MKETPEVNPFSVYDSLDWNASTHVTQLPSVRWWAGWVLDLFQNQINCKLCVTGPNVVLLFEEHYQGREAVVASSPFQDPGSRTGPHRHVFLQTCSDKTIILHHSWGRPAASPLWPNTEIKMIWSKDFICGIKILFKSLSLPVSEKLAMCHKHVFSITNEFFTEESL